MDAIASTLPEKDIEIRLIKRLLHACLREQLLPYFLDNSRIIVSLQRSKKTIVANNIQEFCLNKFKINGEVELIEWGSSRILSDINHVLDLIYAELQDDIDSKYWQNFVAEINNCKTNETSVNHFMQNFNHQLSKDISHSSSNTLFEFIASQYSPAKQLMFYEAWAVKGHPYHPCHKTKLGFSEDAHRQYSPEFHEDIHLPLAAIDKSLMHVESEQIDSEIIKDKEMNGQNIQDHHDINFDSDSFDYHQWFAKQFPQAWQAWLSKLSMQGLSQQDYHPLFIHPWQYENTLRKLFPDIITNKQLILFHDTYINTKASLSFRTLAINNEAHQPHIKLPLAIHSTSGMRAISPASVHNGPKLGNIIRSILKKENNFNASLKVSFETCGMHIKHPDNEVAKHLGIIYRDNPSKLLNQYRNNNKNNNITQSPIVVAALFELSPIDQRPLFIEIIQTATGKKLDKNLNAAASFFDNYCRIVINAYLDLFLIYGIALEGHQQNTIAVFENAQPMHMIARDFGGLYIHMPTLRQHGYDFRAHTKSTIISDDRENAANIFLHSVIQYHLGELALLLADHYQAPESVFLKIIRNNLESRFTQIKDKVQPLRWEQEYKAIFEDDWKTKSLMKMRLSNLYNKYIYMNLKNPLRDL